MSNTGTSWMLFTKRKYDASHGISVAAAYILLYTVRGESRNIKEGSLEFGVCNSGKEGGRGGGTINAPKDAFSCLQNVSKIVGKGGGGVGFRLTPKSILVLGKNDTTEVRTAINLLLTTFILSYDTRSTLIQRHWLENNYFVSYTPFAPTHVYVWTRH